MAQRRTSPHIGRRRKDNGPDRNLHGQAAEASPRFAEGQNACAPRRPSPLFRAAARRGGAVAPRGPGPGPWRHGRAPYLWGAAPVRRGDRRSGRHCENRRHGVPQGRPGHRDASPARRGGGGGAGRRHGRRELLHRHRRQRAAVSAAPEAGGGVPGMRALRRSSLRRDHSPRRVQCRLAGSRRRGSGWPPWSWPPRPSLSHTRSSSAIS